MLLLISWPSSKQIQTKHSKNEWQHLRSDTEGIPPEAVDMIVFHDPDSLSKQGKKQLLCLLQAASISLAAYIARKSSLWVTRCCPKPNFFRTVCDLGSDAFVMWI